MFIIGITRILNYQNTMNIEKKKNKKTRTWFLHICNGQKKTSSFPTNHERLSNNRKRICIYYASRTVTFDK